MRLIIKIIAVVILAAIYIYSSSIIAHRNELDTRVTMFSQNYDTIFNKYLKCDYPAETCLQPILDQVEAGAVQAGDLRAELKCWDEDTRRSCNRLRHQERVLKFLLENEARRKAIIDSRRSAKATLKGDA